MTQEVLAAARRIVSERGGTDRLVSLAELQRDPEIGRLVNTPARLLDIMADLQDARQARMVCRHPEPRWYVSAPAL